MTTPEAIKRRQKRISFALGFVLAVLVGFIVFALVERSRNQTDLQEARFQFCVEVEAIRTYARDSATRSLESLPTVDYYRNHPDELQAAIRNIERQRAEFDPPLDCEAFSTGDPPVETTEGS